MLERTLEGELSLVFWKRLIHLSRPNPTQALLGEPGGRGRITPLPPDHNGPENRKAAHLREPPRNPCTAAIRRTVTILLRCRYPASSQNSLTRKA